MDGGEGGFRSQNQLNSNLESTIPNQLGDVGQEWNAKNHLDY